MIKFTFLNEQRGLGHQWNGPASMSSRKSAFIISGWAFSTSSIRSVRSFSDCFCQQAASPQSPHSPEANHQASDGMFFNVFAHIKSLEGQSLNLGQLFANFCSSHAVGPAKIKLPIGFSARDSPSEGYILELYKRDCMASSWPKIKRTLVSYPDLWVELVYLIVQLDAALSSLLNCFNFFSTNVQSLCSRLGWFLIEHLIK